MTYRYPDFQSQATEIYSTFATYASRASEWTAIIAAVAADTRTQAVPVAAAPAALTPAIANSQMKNRLDLLVNRGLAGNLVQGQMVSALSAVSGAAAVPGNIDKAYITSSATPAVSGSVLTSTTGNWASPSSSISGYTYQWTRNGTNIASATSSTYTLTGSDVGGQDIRCNVVATNTTGASAAMPSHKYRVP